MASVARSLLVASKATRVLNAASVRSFSRSPVAGAEVDVVQKLYINELKKVAEEQKKKPSPEKEILAQITAQREARQKDAAAKEAAYKKEVEAALKEYAEYEAKTKEAAKKAPGAPAAAAAAAPEVTREDNKRIFLLKQFGFPETADLTVVAPAFLKKLGENALAAAIKAYRAEVESLTSQGQWVAVPSIPNIRKLAEQLNKVGIPAGADLFVAVRLSKQEWVDDEVAILANDLIKEDIREVERKRIIDRIMVLVVLEHTEEEQELLKLVGSKTETAIDTAAAEREIELARLGAAFEAKKKLYLSKIGFPTDDDLASAAAAVAKSDH